MSLERLVAAIEQAAAAEAAAVRSAADRETAMLLSSAAARADETRETARQLALEPLAARRGALQLQAQLNAAHVRETECAQWVETALRKAHEPLQRLRSSGDYSAWMAGILAETVAALEAPGPISIEVDPRDEALVSGLAPNDRPVTVLHVLSTAGGLCVATADGRLRVDNTIETRLARALPALRTRLAQLFLAADP